MASLTASTCFFLLYRLKLASIAPVPDEGVYLLLAKRVAAGEIPLVDFFTHVPPTFIQLLAWLMPAFDANLAAFRCVSLCAVASAGITIFVACRRDCGDLPALLAQVFYFSTAWVQPSLATTPGALAVPLAACGACIYLSSSTRPTAVASAALLTFSVALKPIALGAGLLMTLHATVVRPRRFAIGFLSSMAVTGGLALTWLQFTTDGNFITLVVQQFHRFSIQSGFVVARELVGWRLLNQVDADTSRLYWNFSQLLFFFRGSRQAIPWLAATLVWMQLALAIAAFTTRRPTPLTRWAWAWVALELGLFIFAWDPAWREYGAVFAAPLAILAGSGLNRCRRFITASPYASAGFAYVGLAVFLAGWLSVLTVPGFYSRIDELRASMRPYVTLNPLIAFMLGEQSQCQFDDPFNTHSALLPVFRDDRFGNIRQPLSDDTFLECLRQHADAKVVIDTIYTIFVAEFRQVNNYMRVRSDRATYFSDASRAQWQRIAQY